MKKMLVVVGMIAVVGILYACGGGGSSPGGTTGGTNTTGGNNTTGGSSVGLAAPAISAPKPVATKQEVVKTVSSSTTLASSFVKGGGIPNLGSLVGKLAGGSPSKGHSIVDTILGLQDKILAVQQKPAVLAKQVAATTGIQPITEPCTDGGTRTISFDDNGFSMSANQCKEAGTIENGTVSIAGISVISGADFTGATVVTNLTTVDYASGGYTTKTSESVMNMTMKINSMTTTGTSMSLQLSGTKNDQNYVNKSSEKSSFSNFSMNITMPSASQLNSPQTTLILDGVSNMETYKDANFTTLDTKSGMTLQQLKLVENVTLTGSSMAIDGTYAVATIPTCLDGTFVISTQAPITSDGSGKTIGGQMTVNGVVMVFKSDGSVEATINGTKELISAAEVAANACQIDFAGASF
ncbi:MAG TPA: hypothetical protein VN642_12915 [Dongiaceae bacterium]|nr:hypothetical protein [Dongiaceae bacterium]